MCFGATKRTTKRRCVKSLAFAELCTASSRAFYAKHDAAILTKNKGNEAKLYSELELKYGARP